jgi:hypothetical protein
MARSKPNKLKSPHKQQIEEQNNKDKVETTPHITPQKSKPNKTTTGVEVRSTKSSTPREKYIRNPENIPYYDGDTLDRRIYRRDRNKHQLTGERSKLNQTYMHPLFCPILIDACKKAHHLLNGQNEQHKRFMLVTFITTQNRSPWYGIPRQNSYHHNFMLHSMITSTLFKHPIRTSNNQTPWIVYSKQTDIYTMTLLAMNTHTYSLPGDQTYTQTT